MGPSTRSGTLAAADGREADDHSASPTLRHSAERLRETVASIALPLDVPGVIERRQTLGDLLAQFDDYLLPRLRRMDAPLLAVVGGSTGAGKSTLVNSLVRRVVTRSGVLRPTTRSPVLIHHPYDSGAFLTQRILPGFARVTSEAPEPLQPIDVDAPRVTALRLVPDEGLAPGLAIIDAPDIDSLVETNRDLAIQLLAAGDLWIFVTTAARYSDAVPWDMLRTAVDRGVAVAVVLDRVPSDAMSEVRMHLATMLRDRGLSTAPLFTIPEVPRDTDGFLPEEVVAPLRGWLSRLARNTRTRDVVVRRTLVGVLDSLHERVQSIAAAADEQVVAEQDLRKDLADAFDVAGLELRTRTGDGTLLHGEVLARWQEYVGTGDVFRGLDSTMSRLRIRFSAILRRRPAPSEPLAAALLTAVQATVRSGVVLAVEHAESRWRSRRTGVGLFSADRHAGGLSPDFDIRLGGSVRDWRDVVVQLVRVEARGRRTTARSASFGVEGAAVVLMLLACATQRRPADASAFWPAGGPADDVSGAASAVAGRLLGALFGDEAVRSLVDAARADLLRRIGEQLADERARFEQLLDSARVRTNLAVALRTDLRAIEGAR